MPEQLPSGVRPPLALAHARSDEPTFQKVEFAAGASRRRRVRTRAPETATLQWSLPLAEMALWHDWFEDTLEAGARSFACQVQGRFGSGSLQTVIARFAGPPRTVIRSGWATISTEIVIDEPATIVTSRPYPLDAVDGLALGLRILRMRFGTLTAPPEAMTLGIAVQSGSLRDGLQSAAFAPEAMTLGLTLVGSQLEVPGSDQVGMADEGLTLGLTLETGAMADILIQYANYPDEALGLSLEVQFGTLQ